MTEDKVWGTAHHIHHSNRYNVSLLEVKSGGFCSRHYHKDRFNEFHVHSGRIVVVEYEPEKRTELTSGESCVVRPGVLHRFEVIENGFVVEIYWTENGQPCLFKDIERMDTGGMVETEITA
jgi:mannose-6-phosphate isomerase-like protein (cupin superfamily)